MFLYNLFSLSTKSVFFYEISNILLWLVNLEERFSDVYLLSSGVVIYLSRSRSVVILFSISLICMLCSAFLTILLILAVLFSTEARAVVVAKIVILGNLFLTLFHLALRTAVVTMLVILSICLLTSYI